MTPNVPSVAQQRGDMNATRQRGFSDQPSSLLPSRNNNKEFNNNNTTTSPNVLLLNNNLEHHFGNNYEISSQSDPRRRSVSDSSVPNSMNSSNTQNNDPTSVVVDNFKFYPTSSTSPSSASNVTISTNNLLFNTDSHVPPPPIVISPSTEPHSVAISKNTITEPKQHPHSSSATDEWLVIPILIVSSLPKEVDQLLRTYTCGKHLKKQAPPCCVPHHTEGAKSSTHKNKLKISLNSSLNTVTNQIPKLDKNQLATSDNINQQQHTTAIGDMSQQAISAESNEQKQQPKIPLVYNNYLSPRSSHSRTSTSSNNSSSPNTEEDGQSKHHRDISPPGNHHNKHHSSGRPKHHHHKSSSGSLGVSFQIPQQNLAGVTRSGSRKNVHASGSTTNEDLIPGIQNIQHHIQQQLHLQDNIAVPPQQQTGATTGKKTIPPTVPPKPKTEQDSNKLNYYLRKNKRVTEWYIEEHSVDYLRHLDEFFEKNEVSQLSNISHDLLNTGFHLEDLIAIEEEEFFESYLEKSIPPVPEKKKLLFRVCHTGSRHALSLRQALYKQMLLEQKPEQNQTIAPTVVIFVFSYTNSSCSLENTAMTWMKEINSIYPTFFSQGNFMLAGHIELNKSTKQQIALLRRNVEDAAANVGLVQKPKHYYHFHQKAVPLFQNKKNQRLNIVEFDTRLGTNIPQIFFEAYRLYCLDFYRKSIVNALTTKPLSPQISNTPHSASPNEATNQHHDSQSPPLHSTTLSPENKSSTDDSKKKKDNLAVDTTETTSHISPHTSPHHDEDHPKEETKTGLISPTNILPPQKQESTKTEKTALTLGLLKIFKKTKKEETQVKKPTVEKLLKNQKKKKKKEEEIFRWQKVADNLIMAEKPKKKNKKDNKQGVAIKTDSISSADDHREVMTDTYFLNRKNLSLFPYNVHALEQSDASPQIEKHNSSVLSKPLEENEYLEDPTENDLMGEVSESSSIPDTFEHQFTSNNVITNNTTNSSYQEYNSYFPGDSSFSHPGEVIASDDEEAGLDTENDISSEVDDFTFQSSVGSTPLMANIPTIFTNIGENRHALGGDGLTPRASTATHVWEELDGEDLASVGEMA
ncbi:hypothetical protein C9374_001923 [Naegleria lovaniensis]|uniref:Uncharacterized protein n=1 Tax=Naegleria lovaniensis TaxID=51637 RepID=A0AA88KLP8_NAELO|nr:uncharacterized protein C9374_001923 [Naegleria lovaniensis]KAG2386888.1 hypothetical protein C9374_001923 [Naegleria lovaniensis]